MSQSFVLRTSVHRQSNADVFSPHPAFWLGAHARRMTLQTAQVSSIRSFNCYGKPSPQWPISAPSIIQNLHQVSALETAWPSPAVFAQDGLTVMAGQPASELSATQGASRI